MKISKSYVLALALSPAAFLSAADVAHTSLAINYKNKSDGISVELNTSLTSKLSESINVATFVDAQGRKLSISDKASYTEATRTITHTFKVTREGSNTELASVNTSCALRGAESSCRTQHESDVLNVEVESSVGSAESIAADETAAVLNLAYFRKIIFDPGEDSEQEIQDKVIEAAQLSSDLLLDKEAQLYADSKTKKSLSATLKKGTGRSVVNEFKSTQGPLTLVSRSGERGRLYIQESTGAEKTFAKRELELETVVGKPVTPDVAKSVQMAAVLDYAGKTARKLRVDSRLSLDASGLKPDPAQENYTADRGLIVALEEISVGGENEQLALYWNVDAVAAADTASLQSRTSKFTLEAADDSRVLKVRAKGGQRSVFEFSQSDDLKKKDGSRLEIETVVGDTAAVPAAEPAQPADPVDPFAQ